MPITRLIGAVLVLQNDEWQTVSRYMMLKASDPIDHEEADLFWFKISGNTSQFSFVSKLRGISVRAPIPL